MLPGKLGVSLLNLDMTEPHSSQIASTSVCLTVCNRTLLHYHLRIAKPPPIITSW